MQVSTVMHLSLNTGNRIDVALGSSEPIVLSLSV